MKKFLSLRFMRVIAMTVCMISLAALVLFAAAGLSADGESADEILDDFYGYAGDNYAAAMYTEALGDDFRQNPDAEMDWEGARKYADGNMILAVMECAEPYSLEGATYVYRDADFKSYSHVFHCTQYTLYSYNTGVFHLQGPIYAGNYIVDRPRVTPTPRPTGSPEESNGEEEEPRRVKYFAVLYTVREPLEGDGNTLFDQARRYADLAWTVISFAPWGIILSALLFVLSMLFLIASAGHRGESGEITLIWEDRVPYLIYCATVILVDALAIMAAANLTSWQLGAVPIVLISLCYVAAAIVTLRWVMSTSARIKSGKAWEYTVTIHVLRCFKRLAAAVQENISVFWRTAIFLAVLTIVEFAVVGVYNENTRFTALFIYKIIAIPTVLWAVLQFKNIQKGTERMANGELDQKIDTSRMFFDFKRQAENINRIGDGMNAALEQRMKSERMKTELITNVSHDIKTPLTSIVSYVDLLKKEGVESEHAAEYLDVLERQSARLKKLIGDLTEASKASSGAVEMHIERCDAAVALNQALGEFETRLNGANLELITVLPEGESPVMADGRYLWRVLDNLLGNICKYAMPNTRVYAELRRGESESVISLKNISATPLNISADELTERFVRGDKSRSSEGSGLGLNIARSLTELMGGRLDITVDGDLFKVNVTLKNG